MRNGPHEYAVDHTSFYVTSKLFTQTFLIGRGEVTSLHIAYVKSTKKCRKTNLRVRAIQEPVFPVANTDFEGGDDDHGCGDCIFFVIYAQPSHTALFWCQNLYRELSQLPLRQLSG